MDTAIIFGAGGQDGYYLARHISRQGIRVIGISRNQGTVQGDVSDGGFVETQIKMHQPRYVFHLAANSTTRHEALFENHATISTGTLHILESVYKHSRHTKVFLSGSGLQFENRGLPISEKDPFEARDAYSISRIQSVYAARYYRRLGLKVYVGYFFNHDSPLRPGRHINQQIVQAAKRIAGGSAEKLAIGNINVRKEFTFAGDIADAVWRFVRNDEEYEAVIGSGIAYSIEEWLDICFGFFNLAWRDYVVLQPAFRSDYEILVSDPQILRKLGWIPGTDIKQLAEMMISYQGTPAG